MLHLDCDNLFGLQMNTKDNSEMQSKKYRQYWLLLMLNKIVNQKFGKINILLGKQ